MIHDLSSTPAKGSRVDLFSAILIVQMYDTRGHYGEYEQKKNMQWYIGLLDVKSMFRPAQSKCYVVTWYHHMTHL